MKNREKFIEQIVKSIKDCDSCDFMIKTVNPVYSDVWESNDELCQRDECEACSKLFAFWLDEEYIEPPKPEVDWDNVPVDTLVRVRNDEDSPWVLQYFKEFDEERSYKFLAWSNGRTSKTTDGRIKGWKYCELVED